MAELEDNLNLDLEARLGRNDSKKSAEFRDSKAAGIDVEYQKVRLERVFLISSWSNAKLTEKEANYSLDELERLALTAGAEVLGKLTQQNPLPDITTYLGKGKVQELKNYCDELGVDTVIANSVLSPSQRRNLEDKLELKVLDRTELILDIFAQHATSKEGKVQIELAQLEYLLPRLRGWGKALSRQGGGQVGGGAGMGSRGPGETQLEVDRRRINSKIAILKLKLKKIKKERAVSKKNRLKSEVPSVAIVGYTNAGKSSLLNALSGSKILVQDALFATLETTTRKIQKPRFTVSDTVGFIQDLPHNLVEAFRSTLDEALDSDILLHLVDISSPDPKKQISAVNIALKEIRAVDEDFKVVLFENENEILVFNKTDSVTSEELDRFKRMFPNAIFISVYENRGIDELIEKILKTISKLDKFEEVSLLVPYSDGKKLAEIYSVGEVLSRTETNDGFRIKAILPKNSNLTKQL